MDSAYADTQRVSASNSRCSSVVLDLRIEPSSDVRVRGDIWVPKMPRAEGGDIRETGQAYYGDEAKEGAAAVMTPTMAHTWLQMGSYEKSNLEGFLERPRTASRTINSMRNPRGRHQRTNDPVASQKEQGARRNASNRIPLSGDRQESAHSFSASAFEAYRRPTENIPSTRGSLMARDTRMTSSNETHSTRNSHQGTKQETDRPGESSTLSSERLGDSSTRQRHTSRRASQNREARSTRRQETSCVSSRSQGAGRERRMADPSPSSLWKTAVDPKSGRTYYYHTVTRESQWRKPVELASEAERKEMELKERQQKDFFAAMEANILKSISQGAYEKSPTTVATPMDGFEDLLDSHKGHTNEDMSDGDAEKHEETSKTSPVISSIPRPGKLVRTISTMDEAVLRELVQRVPSHRSLMRGSDAAGSSSFSFPLSSINSSRSMATSSVSSAYARQRESIASLGLLSIQEDEVDSSLNNDDESNSSHYTGPAIEVSVLPKTREEEPSSSKAVKRESSASSRSMTSLLNGLADERRQSSRRSMFGAGWMNESAFSFGLSDDETKALQELAAISDEMANVEADDESLNGLDLIKDEEIVISVKEEAKKGPTGSNGRLGQAVRPPSRDKVVPATVPALPRPVPLNGATAPDLDRIQKPAALMTRRNTCGTLYVSSTMSAPDKDGTIKCVCAVYRAHILQSESEEAKTYDNKSDGYCLFNDWETLQRRSTQTKATRFKPNVPSLEEVKTFYSDIFRRAKMEADCIIMSLVYVERLIKSTFGALRPSARNWRSILFSCMVLSSKVWDDLSMWNADFSQTCPAGVKFSLKRVNELEVAVLAALNYKVKVPSSEYAKYYFLMRSMLIKSGLSGDMPQTMTPLDVEGAKRLQQVSSLYQSAAPTSGATRSKSVGAIGGDRILGPFESPVETKTGKVGLEHVVDMS